MEWTTIAVILLVEMSASASSAIAKALWGLSWGQIAYILSLMNLALILYVGIRFC